MPAEKGRAEFFAETLTLEAIDAIDLVFWAGVQTASTTGYSYWIYPTNLSWVGSPPKYHHGQRTQGYNWEEGFDSLVNNSWFGMSGELLTPRHTSYSWDWTTGAGNQVLSSGNNAGWAPKFSAWAKEPQFVFGIVLNLNATHPALQTHVSMMGLRVTRVELAMTQQAAQVAGSVLFVIDSDGDLVFSSVPGASYVCPAWSTCTQTQGVACTEPAIALTSAELVARGLLSATATADGDQQNSVFVLGSTLVTARSLPVLGGYPLGTPWLVVAIEPVWCDPGLYFAVSSFGCLKCAGAESSTGGASLSCDTCLSGYYRRPSDDNGGGSGGGGGGGSSCQKCPNGATCDGASTLASLNLKKGHWRISEASTRVLECPLRGGCLGGQNFTSHSHSYSDDDDDDGSVGSSSGGGGSSAYCANGFEGVLCAVCSERHFYHQDRNTCAACGEPSLLTAKEHVRSSAMLLVLFFGLVLAVVGLVGVGVLGSGSGEGQTGCLCVALRALIHWLDAVRRNTKLVLKSLMSFAQIASSTSFNCGMRFPATVESSLNLLSVANLDVLPSLGLPCWLKKFDYIDTMVTKTVGPLVLCLAIGLLYLTTEALRATKERAARRRQNQANGNTAQQRGWGGGGGGKALAQIYKAPPEMEALFSKHELKSMRKNFAFYDKDRSGAIDEDEVRQAIKFSDPNAAAGITKEQLNDLFNEVKGPDNQIGLRSFVCNEGDNEISFEEFLGEMLRRIRRERFLEHETDQAEGGHLDHTGRRKEVYRRPSTAFAALQDKVYAKASRSSSNAFVYAVLVVSFLVLQSTTSSLCQYFRCRVFSTGDGGPTVSYMYTDYNISCQSPRYRAFMLYAGSMMLVYPIGIPLSWFVMLRRQRHLLHNPKLMAREEATGLPQTGHLSFLVESYKPKYYLFEVIECVRRVLLTSIIGLIDEDSAYGPIAAIVICLVFIYIFSEYKPFKDRANSFLGIILMHTLTLLFLAALIVKLGALSNSQTEQAAFTAMVLVLVFGSIALGLTVASVKTHLQRRKAFLANHPPASGDVAAANPNSTKKKKEGAEVPQISRGGIEDTKEIEEEGDKKDALYPMQPSLKRRTLAAAVFRNSTPVPIRTSLHPPTPTYHSSVLAGGEFPPPADDVYVPVEDGPALFKTTSDPTAAAAASPWAASNRHEFLLDVGQQLPTTRLTATSPLGGLESAETSASSSASSSLELPAPRPSTHLMMPAEASALDAEKMAELYALLQQNQKGPSFALSQLLDQTKAKYGVPSGMKRNASSSTPKLGGPPLPRPIRRNSKISESSRASTNRSNSVAGGIANV